MERELAPFRKNTSEGLLLCLHENSFQFFLQMGELVTPKITFENLNLFSFGKSQNSSSYQKIVSGSAP